MHKQENTEENKISKNIDDLTKFIELVKIKYPKAYCYNHPEGHKIIFSEPDVIKAERLSKDFFEGKTATSESQAWMEAFDKIQESEQLSINKNRAKMETTDKTKEVNLKEFNPGDYVKLTVNEESGKTIVKAKVLASSDSELQLASVNQLNAPKEQRYQKELTVPVGNIISATIDKFPYQKFDYSELRFPLLGKTSETLGKENIALLLSGKDTKLIEGLVKNNEENQKVTLEPAKLKLQRNDSGAIYLNITEKAEKLVIGKDDNNILLGVDLSPYREKLETLGHIGLVKNLETSTGTKFDAYISLDKDTNRLAFMSKDAVTLQDSIKGKVLTKDEKTAIEQGSVVKLEGMKSKDGKPFNAYVTMDAVKKNITFFKLTDKTAKKYAVDMTEKIDKKASKNNGLKK